MLREEAPFINNLAATKDETKKRSLWVQQDDATVPRRDSNRGKGWRMTGGHTGGRGGLGHMKSRGDSS